jgi:hypothetical protein
MQYLKNNKCMLYIVIQRGKGEKHVGEYFISQHEQ